MRITFLMVCLIFLQGCAAAYVTADVAPDVQISKEQAVYLKEAKNQSIQQQKYYAALRDVLRDDGFQIAGSKNTAALILSVTFNDFAAPVVEAVPTVSTTYYSGSAGNVFGSGQGTTIGTDYVETSVQTHNSTLTVTDAKTGRQLWQSVIATPADIYNSDKLKTLLSSALSFYGTRGKAEHIVSE